MTLRAKLNTQSPPSALPKITTVVKMSTTPSLVNLSLAFRDEIGGSHVNLMNSKTPADIYKVIADKTIWKLEAIVASVPKRNSAEMGQPEEITDADLAQWWLDFGITRKVTKRNCMTFPYGSKQRGFSDQILEDHLHPCPKMKQLRNGTPAKNGLSPKSAP